MNLQTLRKQIEEAGFSEETKKALLVIIDQAVTQGSLAVEEKKKILDIIDLEVDQNNLESDVREELAVALESFANETNSNFEIAERKVNEISEEVNQEAQVLQNEATKSSTDTVMPLKPNSV